MVSKKKLVAILFCVAIVMINASFVCAGSIDEIIENIYVQSTDEEYSHIEEVYKQETEHIKQSAMTLGNIDDAICKTLSELNFHRLYIPKANMNYYDEFQKSGSLKNIISDYYYMESLVFDNKDNVVSAFGIREMPYYDDLIDMGYEFEDETAQMIKDVEGKYILASQGLKIPIEWYEKINDPDQLKELVNSQLNNEEMVNMTIVHVGAYHMYLILIEGESNEYGIPITSREDFLKLKNGKLYDIEDIVNSWGVYYNLGGLSVRGGITGENNEVIFVLLALGAAIVALGVIKVRKSMKNKKSSLK